MLQVRLVILKFQLLLLLFPFLVRVFWSFFEDSLEKILKKSPLYPLLMISVTFVSTLIFIGTSSYIYTINTPDYKNEQEETIAKRKARFDQKAEIQATLLDFSQENVVTISENSIGHDEFPLLYNDYKEWLTTQPVSPQLLYNAAVLASWSGQFEAAQSLVELAKNK